MFVNSDGEDRISALPDDIIRQILSFMPMDSAIRTGILSKRWLHLWKFNPVIEFLSFPVSNTVPIDYGFVNECLRLYRAPKIRKFAIISEFGVFSEPNIENWVDFATARHVRVLEFYWLVEPISGKVFNLPNSIYIQNSESIEQLVLSNVDFRPPPPRLGFSGFVSLKKLSLFYSKLTDEALQAIMSTCLLLESLVLQKCYGLVNVKVSGMALKEFVYYWCLLGGETSLEVDAPNLLTLKTWHMLKIIRLQNTSRLLEARLFDVLIQDGEKGRLRTLLGQLAQLKLLGANGWFLQYMIQEHYMNGTRCNTFKNLKEFYFVGSLSREYDLVMFLAFLEDCPLLKKLQMDFRICCWNGIHNKLPFSDQKFGPSYPPGTDYFIKLEDGEGVPQVGHLHQLKSIELLYFSGFKHEMELVKLFLQAAVRLETLSLIFEDPEQHVRERLLEDEISLHERELLWEQVSLFPRASPRAQILLG